jgi:hypothetical protein
VQVPSDDVPCDLGADAEDDEDGAAVLNSVLLCPPTNCMAAGSCNGHRTFEKDAGKCGLDTSAQVRLSTHARAHTHACTGARRRACVLYLHAPRPRPARA